MKVVKFVEWGYEFVSAAMPEDDAKTLIQRLAAKGITNAYAVDAVVVPL